ncbi:MAG: alpha/beta hydrolase [Verrucomicrobiota bacterium]|nr:alpha/beta hydrolase [Verrucomicrobiota bacterium]
MAAGASDRVPFILLHGLVISSLYMIPLAKVIAAAGLDVHALDLPGFGRSEGPSEVLSVAQLADSVIEWMDASGIPKCQIVGHSLGCEIAAYVAVKAPDRVATLAMIGPTLDPAASAVRIQTLRLLRDALHEPFSLWLKWLFDFFRAGPRRAFGTTREMFRDPIENQLPRVTAPTLVMRGGIDPTVPQSAAVAVARLLPNSELLVIEGEPHCAHYTAPLAVWRAIELHVGSE